MDWDQTLKAFNCQTCEHPRFNHRDNAEYRRIHGGKGTGCDRPGCTCEKEN